MAYSGSPHLSKAGRQAVDLVHQILSGQPAIGLLVPYSGQNDTHAFSGLAIFRSVQVVFPDVFP